MSNTFDYFVVLAAMRTGSNFLEKNLNDYKGLCCWGEVFNPTFVGHADQGDLLGYDLARREDDPAGLIAALRAKTSGLAGFRLFPGHDPRVLEMVLADPRCAKIVLTRNPLDSYVSHAIAEATDQWKLGDLKTLVTAQVEFVEADFLRMQAALQAFQIQLLNRLQVTGQTAFYVGYEDIQNLDVLNGLAAFLGLSEVKDSINTDYKVQNPMEMSEKVSNYAEMVQALGHFDYFDLNRTPNFEPRRGPAVPHYVAAPNAPLLYMPIQAGPVDVVRDWLSALDGGAALVEGFNQKTLRQWKKDHPGHRSFAVVRHPVARLHGAFCRHILVPGPQAYGRIRAWLLHKYKMPFPDAGPGPDWTAAQQKAAFLAFAAFVKGNLNGQTSVRVDAAWASQTEVLQGMQAFNLADAVLREDDLADELPALARAVGRADAPAPGRAQPDAPFALAEVYDKEVERAVRGAYARDYQMFGFSDWAP